MATEFDRFDWAGCDRWQEIERNLYFSGVDARERERILRKRKAKWYKANIDANYEPDAEPAPQQQQQQQQQQQSKPAPQRTTSPPPQQPSPSPRAAAGSSSGAAAGTFLAKYGVYISYVQLALHAILLLNGFTYLLPLAGADQQAPSFGRVLLLNLLAQGIYLLRQHGRPRWNAEYGRLLITDEQTHFMFLSIVLLSAPPMSLLLAPFMIRSALFVAGGLKQILSRQAPRVWTVAKRPIDALVARYSELYGLNAMLEVLAGFMVIFNLLTPNRNLMLIFGLWQYLRIRYMISADSKRAWASVRARTDGWASHSMVPAPIKAAYAKVVSLAEQYTDEAAMAAQQQQAGGGIMSKCTIM